MATTTGRLSRSTCRAALRDRSARRAGAVHDPPRRVLGGRYDSLNLGRLTDDDPDAVNRNRASLEPSIGARWRSSARSRSGAGARRRRAGAARRRRAGGRRPGHRAAPAGAARRSPPTACRSRSPATAPSRWSTPAGAASPAGVLEAGVRRCASSAATDSWRGDRPRRGACCYEVGEEVHAAFADQPSARAGPQPRPAGDRAPRSSQRGRRGARCTTSACARSARTARCSSPTAATAASPAGRRGVAWLS